MKKEKQAKMNAVRMFWEELVLGILLLTVYMVVSLYRLGKRLLLETPVKS